MRTVKVLRTPEDALRHKAEKGGNISVPAVEGKATAEPEPESEPNDESSEDDSASSDSSDDSASSDSSTESLEEVVDRLKEENKADELDELAESLGLDISGNKTEVATAIAMKQLGIEE